MVALTEWLNRLDSEKILLVEIDPDGTPIYIADTAYTTEPTDTPPNQPYSPIIAKNGIPRLARRIQEVWGGRSMPSWGPLELATQFVNGNDLASMNLRGKKVNVLITGPRFNVNRADAVTILTGRIGPMSGNADGGLSIEIQDDQARWDEIELPINQYNGTESASFPSANIGLSKPLALGQCRNVPAVLIDQANLIYQVNDGTLQAIDAVYDNGVLIAFTADLNSGTFSLASAPAGVISADLKGIIDTVWLDSTPALIDWIARTYGGLAAASIDISGLPIDTIGFFINSPMRLSDVITRLMQGVLGWWGFDRLGVFKARILNPPVGGGPIFSETKHLNDLVWDDEDEIFFTIPVRYYRNWMRLEPASSVDANTASWMRSDGYISRVEDATIKTTYTSATSANIIDTYFDLQIAADAIATRALLLFGTLRRRSQVALPISNPMLELGSEISFLNADVVSGDHIIMSLSDIWDGEIPKVDVEVWG